MRKLATREENEKKWTMQATCTGEGWDQEGLTPCLSLFELDSMDIYKRSYTDYGGYTDVYYGFICPDCGCFTELNEKDLPSYVKTNAKEYIPVNRRLKESDR